MKPPKQARVSEGVLSRLYKEPLSLRDAVSRLVPCEAALTESLLQPGATRVVWQRYEEFLQRTIVCFRSRLPVLQQPWRLSQRYTQEQVVLQAIDSLVSSGADNVLRAGYKKRTTGRNTNFVPGLFHAQPWHPNSVMGLLVSPEWCQLLSRVGDEVMLVLLLHGAVFQPLPGGNYLQLTGTPVHVVARDKANLPSQQLPAADWLLTTYQQQQQTGQGGSSGRKRGQHASQCSGSSTMHPVGLPVSGVGQQQQQQQGKTSRAAEHRQQRGHQQTVAGSQHPPTAGGARASGPRAAASVAAAAASVMPSQEVAGPATAVAAAGNPSNGASAAASKPKEACRPPPWLRKKLKLQQLQQQQQANEQQLQQQQQQQPSNLDKLQEEPPPLAAKQPPPQQQQAVNTNVDHVFLADFDSCDEPATQVLPDSPLALWDFDDADSGSSHQPPPPTQQQHSALDLDFTMDLDIPSLQQQRQQQQQQHTSQSAPLEAMQIDIPATRVAGGQQQQQHQQQWTQQRCHSQVGQHEAMQEGSVYSDKPHQEQQHLHVQTAAPAAAVPPLTTRRTAAAGIRGLRSAKRPNPGSWMLPRNVIFHCSTFSRKPGLPAAHVLRKMRATPSAAKMLYHDIFMNPQPPQVHGAAAAAGSSARTSAAAAAKHRVALHLARHNQQQQRPGAGAAGNTAAAAIKVRPGHKALVQMLKRMIMRAEKCPYGLLLNHHCPLPAAAAANPAPAAAGPASGRAAAAMRTTSPLQASTPAANMAAAAACEGAVGMDVDDQSPPPAPSAQQQQQPGNQCNKSAAAAAKPAGARCSAGRLPGHTPPQAATAPGGSSGASTQQQQRAPSQLPLAAQVVPHAAVERYVWSVLRHVVPPALLGSTHNKQVLRRAVKTVIRLRRHETVRLDILVKGLKTSHMPWLSARAAPAAAARRTSPGPTAAAAAGAGEKHVNASSSSSSGCSVPVSLHICHQRWLSCWCWWLMTSMVLPLLRNSFYVTESEPYRQAVFYYRKTVWHQLSLLGLQELKTTCFKPIAPATAAALLQQRSLGVARLRLLPKRNGMRPIAKLGSSSVVKFRSSSTGVARTSARAGQPAPKRAAVGQGSRPVAVGPGQSGSSAAAAAAPAAAGQTGRLAAGSGSASTTRPNQQPVAGRAPHRGWRKRGLRLATAVAGSGGPVRVVGAKWPAAAAARHSGGVLTFKPVNMVLQPAFQALRAEVDAKPGILACSVFGLDDICRTLYPFIRRFRAEQVADPGLRPYIISADIRKAFDSVVVPRLLSLVSPLMGHAEYQLMRYTTTSPQLGSVRVRYRTEALLPALPAGQLGGRAPVVLASGSNAAVYPSFPTWARSWVSAARSSNTVFTDQVPYRIISLQEVCQLLQQHLTANLLRVGGTWLQQTVGIAQGSIASTLLCSIYLADLERQHLMPLLPGLSGSSNSASNMQPGTQTGVIAGAVARPASAAALAAGMAYSSPCGISALAAVAATSTSPSVVAALAATTQQQQQLTQMFSPLRSVPGQQVAGMITPAAAVARPFASAAAAAATGGNAFTNTLYSPAAPSSGGHESCQASKSGSGPGSNGKLTQSGGKLSTQSGGKSNKSLYSTQPSTDDPERLPGTRRRPPSGAAATDGVPKLVLPPPSASMLAAPHLAAVTAAEAGQAALAAREQSLQDHLSQRQQQRGQTLLFAGPAAAGDQEMIPATEPDAMITPVAADSQGATTAAAAATTVTEAGRCRVVLHSGPIAVALAGVSSPPFSDGGVAATSAPNPYGMGLQQETSSQHAVTPAATAAGSSPAGSSLPELVLTLMGGSTPSKQSPAAAAATEVAAPVPAPAAGQDTTSKVSPAADAQQLPAAEAGGAGSTTHGPAAGAQTQTVPARSEEAIAVPAAPSELGQQQQQQQQRFRQNGLHCSDHRGSALTVAGVQEVAAAAAATATTLVCMAKTKPVLSGDVAAPAAAAAAASPGSSEPLLPTQPATHVAPMDVDYHHHQQQQKETPHITTAAAAGLAVGVELLASNGDALQANEQQQQKSPLAADSVPIAGGAGSSGVQTSGSSLPTTECFEEQQQLSEVTSDCMVTQDCNRFDAAACEQQEQEQLSMPTTTVTAAAANKDESAVQLMESSPQQQQQQQASVAAAQLSAGAALPAGAADRVQPQQLCCKAIAPSVAAEHSTAAPKQPHQQPALAPLAAAGAIAPIAMEAASQRQQGTQLCAGTVAETTPAAGGVVVQQQQQLSQCQPSPVQNPAIVSESQQQQQQQHREEMQAAAAVAASPSNMVQQEHRGQPVAAASQPTPAAPADSVGMYPQTEKELLTGQMQWPASLPCSQRSQQHSGRASLEQHRQQHAAEQNAHEQQETAAQAGAAAAAGSSRAARRRPDSVLMRLVDDSLAITTSRAAAEAFMTRLIHGFPDYNCSINPSKTQLNFSLTTPDGTRLQPNVWKSKDGSCWVRWCGLLINVVNLELMADYTRYSGQHIATSLTLNLADHPGCMLLQKVLSYMRPKMHALLLDNVINSPLTIRLNIYQAFLLSFMKLHWAIRCLLRDRGSQQDPRLVLRAIQGCINYTVGLVRGRISMARKRLQLDVRCSVSRCHIRWLGLSAARRVLGRKQSAYKQVLAALDKQLQDSSFRHVRRHLAAITEASRSAVFDEVLY